MKKPAKKIVKKTVVAKANGDIVEKRLVRHKDGKVSIRNVRLACGLPTAKDKVMLRTFEAKPEPSAPKPETISAKKKAKRVTPNKLATPETVTDRIHHEILEFSKGAYVTLIKPTQVTTTNRAALILKKAKAKSGSHVELFERDYTLVNFGGLRSVNLEGSPGGKPMPLPLQKLQAQERLREFARRYPNSYAVCSLILINNGTAEMISDTLTDTEKKKGGANRLIQKSVEDLASFYSPRKARINRKLLDLAQRVDQDAHNYEGGRVSSFNVYPAESLVDPSARRS